MTRRRGAWRTWGAVLAAYLIVIQATLTGMTLGAQASVSHAAALEIICAPSGSAADGAQAPAEHHSAPTCCVAGCLMLGGGLGPPPDIAFAVPHLAAAGAGPDYRALDGPAPTPERSSRTSRAPPRTA